ncbi:MAG: flagellar biosynthetic protein FliO [Pelosinus sp.]|jgi:flagellar protein FliO/FliZ|nr:flagellar biosynthetic protein FliO [Pelosinus sp.]
MLSKKKSVLVMMVCVVFVFCAVSVSLVQAAQEAPSQSSGYLSNYQDTSTAQPAQSSWLSTVAYLISLVMVFVFVVGLAYFASRFLGKKFGTVNLGKSSKILESLQLGTNQAIYVVEIAGEVLLIGVTDHNITLLNKITDELEIGKLRSQADFNFANESFNHMFENQLVSLERMARKVPNILNINRDRK